MMLCNALPLCSEQFKLIVFTQVNSRPIILFYNLVVPFANWLKSMGILQTSMVFPYYWSTEYQQTASTAPKLVHEYNKYK